MEQRRSGGHQVRTISTVMRRFPNHKKTIKLMCDYCHSERKLVSWMPYHAVFGFLIPLLIAVLQVNNQSTNKYTFETHPENLWVFLLATFVYCFAFAADIKFQSYNPYYAQLSCIAAVISGSLSSVSLITIFLTGLPARLIFVIWASMSITFVLTGLVISICCRFYQMFTKFFFVIDGIWNRFRGSSVVEQPRLPV